ncbi:MAG: hypothetical protein AAF725_08945 [Acidobacteriota bacterium]
MENRTFWIVIVLLVVGLGFVLFQPTLEETLAPQLESAWVALEVEDGGVAVVGPVEMAAGTRFTLRAVVRATRRDGSPVYYTEASRLRLEGEEIPPEQIQPWDRGKPIKIRWYTVEGRWPFQPLDAETGIGSFQFQEFLRSDWPLAWSIPGDLDAHNDNHLETSPLVPRQIFGTQRYQVGVELYRREDDLVPERVIRSWGLADLKERIDSFPTAIARAPEGAGGASQVFGLTQLEPPEQPDAQVLTQIKELSDNGIAFSRLTLLHGLAKASGRSFSELSWRSVELTGSEPWTAADPKKSEGVAAGDFLRVGDRVVVLYEDRGQSGFLDYDDLCFDFVQGAEVRALAEVFSGDGLDVQTAPVGRLAAQASSASAPAAQAAENAAP